MNKLNYHPEKVTDAISFHPEAKTNQCRCRHRDPLVVSHPATGLWFQLCKSCGDRIGEASYKHEGRIPRSVPAPNIDDIKLKVKKTVSPNWLDGGVAERGRGAYVDDSGHHPGTNDMGMARQQGKPTRLKKETATQGVAMWVNGEIVDAAEYDYKSITRDNKRRHMKSRILFFGIIGVTIIVILIGG